MSVTETQLITSLQTNLPPTVVTELVKEYKHIKQSYFLQKWRPTELNCARFGECVLRILEHVNGDPLTPFGTEVKSDPLIRKVEGNVTLSDSMRFHVPRLVRVVLDFRNKRDVAHVGGEVSPNHSDSKLVVQSADWIMAELVRKYHGVSIQEATKIVESINEIKVPIINEFDGFVRVLDTSLKAKDKTLCILYHKQPDKVDDQNLLKWMNYSTIGNLRSQILKPLHEEAFIHYMNGYAELTSKGIAYAEKYIPMDKLII